MNYIAGRTFDDASAAELCEVIITAPDGDWLAEFIRGLIEDRLCASSHLSQIRSIYPWKGQIHDTTETRATLRTRTALVSEIIARTRLAHPYDIPSIVAVPVVAANPDYTQWVLTNTIT